MIGNKLRNMSYLKQPEMFRLAALLDYLEGKRPGISVYRHLFGKEEGDNILDENYVSRDDILFCPKSFKEVEYFNPNHHIDRTYIHLRYPGSLEAAYYSVNYYNKKVIYRFSFGIDLWWGNDMYFEYICDQKGNIKPIKYNPIDY